MTTPSRPRALLVTALVAAVAACSSADGRPPPAGSASSERPPASGYASSFDGGPRADGDAGGADPCSAFPRTGQTVDEIGVAPPAPASLGGAPTPGTYDLTLVETFLGGAGNNVATGNSAQVTLVVSAAELRMNERRTSGGETIERVSAWRYEVAGNTLEMREICPETGREATVGFSASSPTQLGLLFDGSRRELYALRP